MKGFLVLLLLSCFSQMMAGRGMIQAEDSLLNLLRKTPEKEIERQTELLTHLCLIRESTGQLNEYANSLYTHAIKTGETFSLSTALSCLVQYYMVHNSDSALYYLGEIKDKIKGERGVSMYHYWRMNLRSYEETIRPYENRLINIADSIQLQYMNREGGMSPYERMEWNLLIGDILLLQGGFYAIQLKAIPYYERVMEIAANLPFEYTYSYKTYAMGNLANLYTSEEPDKYGDKAVKLLNDRLEFIDQYEKMWKDKYPFIEVESGRLECYSLLATLPQLIGQEQAKKYLDIYFAAIQNISDADVNIIGYKDGYFVAATHYYQRIGEYERAVEFADSAIVLASDYHLDSLLPSRILFKAQTLKLAGRTAEALAAYEEYVAANDSIFTATSQKRLNDIQAGYGMARMKLDNAEMTLKNHQVGMIGGGLVFVLVILILVILFCASRKGKKMLKKEMELQAGMLAAEEKALEGERMKVSFTQSIVRELRTPLSVISSATELIVDDNLDVAAKKELLPMVKTNIMHLDSLVDYMIEVSELDSSSPKENLEMEPGNISDICRTKINHLMAREEKEGVAFHLDLPDDAHCLINFHKRYFSMMIYALISNAYKFTDKGSITIYCRVFEEHFEFSIADNGKGIPVEKKDWVFERFTKVDPFSSGTGLGLYLCKLITERVGGEIKLDTTYTDGAKFVFTMPCSKYC